MRLSQLPLSIALLALFTPAHAAERASLFACPTVEAAGTAEVMQAGKPITFWVAIAGGSPHLTPTLHWKVSRGKIIAGQGTGSITVDTTGLGDEEVEATVVVGGFIRGCDDSASASARVSAGPPPSMGADWLRLQFHEIEGLHVRGVEFRGNKTTPRRAVKLALGINEGDVFSYSRLEEGLKRINELGRFHRAAEIDVGWRRDVVRGEVYLLVILREKPRRKGR